MKSLIINGEAGSNFVEFMREDYREYQITTKPKISYCV